MSNPETQSTMSASARPEHKERRIGRAWGIAIRLAGFAAGLAMLGWSLSLALRPENRAQLENLTSATPGQIAGLLLLSAASVGINGLVFWITIRPVQRLRAGDTLAINATASMLSYLPLKIGALTRIAIHNRRDRVPLLTIGAWFAAMAIVMGAVMAPLVGAGLWRRDVDVAWVGSAGLGLVAILAVVFVLARALGGRGGAERIGALIRPIDRLTGRNVSGSRQVRELHAGLAILSSPRVLGSTAALRLGDLAIQAGRFSIAARVLGVHLSFSKAMLAAPIHFALSVLSPVGVLGPREAAITILGEAPGVLDASGQGSLAAVVLLVGAAEVVVFLICGTAGLLWLGPHRLFRPRTDRA